MRYSSSKGADRYVRASKNRHIVWVAILTFGLLTFRAAMGRSDTPHFRQAAPAAVAHACRGPGPPDSVLRYLGAFSPQERAFHGMSRLKHFCPSMTWTEIPW